MSISAGGKSMTCEQQSQGKRLYAAFDGGSTSTQVRYVGEDVITGAGGLEVINNKQILQSNVGYSRRKQRGVYRCYSIDVYNLR